MRPHKIVLAVLYLVAFAAIAHYLWSGWSYYRTPLPERPHHDDFWDLKPGGTYGRAFGITGASLMIVMLLYSVRKRARPLRRAGAVGMWLDFHIFCGIVGPLLVILHTSFKVQGLVAISFWSMIAVALSGVLGRYLYRQIPRTRAGDELTLAEVEAQSRELSARLRDEFGMPEETLQEMEAIAAGPSVRSRLRALEKRLRGSHPRGEVRALLRVVEQKTQLHRRIVFWRRLQELFHYWHVFHKPFAVLMYLFMIIHVTVAVLTGYGF